MSRLHGGHVDIDVVLQRLHILSYGHVGTVDEEVHVYEVERAACADGGKIVKIGQAGFTSAVGHCRCAELDGAVIRLHVVSVDRHTLRWREVRACWTVWFVGTVYVFSIGSQEALWGVGGIYANRALVPPSIKIGTRSFHSLFCSLEFTARVGTYEKRSLIWSPRTTSPLEPYVTKGLTT